MKTLQEIYNDIRSKFFNKTNIDIQNGSTIDYFVLASSSMIEEAHKEIEANKTPHIYSNLKGEKLDNMAILCGLSRRANESDENFLYRLLRWNVSNKSSNSSAIETSLMDMQYCSHVTWVSYAFGCGTAAAYIIPKSIDGEYPNLAIQETKDRIKNVISPSTYVEYIIPKIIPVALTVLYKANATDQEVIKSNISSKIMDYVNGIAPGDFLEVGEINKIGINETNVEYFNVSNIVIDGKEIGDVSIMQKVETKLLIDSTSLINWVEVE